MTKEAIETFIKFSRNEVFSNEDYVNTNLIYMKLSNLLTMPWTKLMKEEFINCLVGRLNKEPDFDENMHVKAQTKITDRSAVVGGKILEENSDLIVFEKEDKKFKESYTELLELEYENKKKIDELSIKIKKITKRFNSLLELKMVPSDSKMFNFDALINVEVDSISINGTKYSQIDFQTLFIKINDQLDRIDQYLHELLTTSEFEQLAKKLQMIGVSMTKLKAIDKEREKKYNQK